MAVQAKRPIDEESLASASAALDLAETVATSGEWMWAVARAFEKGKDLHVYLYAARTNQKWQFDMHAGNPGEPPSFGWNVPFIYVPLSEIFIGVYTACKRLLSEQAIEGL